MANHATYQAYLNKLTALGYTLPSADQQYWQNKLIEDLATAGAISRMDAFWLFLQDSSQNSVGVNIVDPDNFQLTQINSPTWTPNVGYQGSGVTQYLETGWIPNVHGVNYTAASASIWLGIGSDVNGNEIDTGDISNTNGRVFIRPRTSNKYGGQINASGTSINGGTATTSIARTLWDRLSNNISVFSDGANVYSVGSTVGSLPTGQFYLMAANNNGGSLNNSSRLLKYVAYAGSMRDIITDVDAAFASYEANYTSPAPANDTTPPTVPTNLQANSITHNSCQITWNASTDDTAVEGYKIYRDGVEIGDVTTLFFNDTGLSGLTQYSYTVSAYDAVPNESSPSSAVVVNTLQTPVAPSFTTQPQSQTVYDGESVLMTVAVDGFPTPTIQWQKDGVDIPGEITTSLIFTASLADNGSVYTAIAENNEGTTVSNGATLTVNPALEAPVATTHPTQNTLSEGQGVTFTGAFSGNPTPTLQWQVNTGSGWSDISGETSETLNFVSQRAQNGYEYRLKGENSEGIEYTNAATLTVEFEAIVDANPQDITINEGLIASFNSTYTDGNPKASIIWQENTGSGWNDLTGESGTTLSFTANRTKNGNQYRLKVSNSEGTVYSSPATLSVNWLEITTQPQDETIDDDQSETLTVSVDGNPSASYQWQMFDGGWSDINGATSSTYQFTPGTIEIPQEDFLLRVVVSNAFGSVTSEEVTVTVNKSAVLPVFTLQPQDVTVQELQQAIFEIDFTGYPEPTVVWKKDGQVLIGETGKTLSLNTVLTDDGSVIIAEIENIAGTVVSSDAILSVTAIPDPGDTVYVLNIVDHGQEVSIGSNDSISATAYQWQTFNSQVQDYEDITGETNQSLTITIGENVNQNIYRLMADNTPSAGFQLNVIPSGEPSWFITQAEVIKIAVEKGNTNTGYIKDVKIRVSENEYIRPAITEALFIHLNQDNLNLTEKEVVLKDMIKEPLAYFVKALCIPEMSIQLGNKGAQLVRGDYSQSGSSKERGELKDSALKIGNSLLKNAVKFIEENINDFPLYEKSNSVRTTAPRRRGGLLLGGNN